MSFKASVSISDQQELLARKLVEEGHFASLSDVVQRGIELVQEETELKDAELAVLRSLIAERRQGRFITSEEGRERMTAMILAKKSAHDL